MVRQRLNEFIWNSTDLPLDTKPDGIDVGIADERFDGHPEVARIDRIIVRLPYGFVANAYHLTPRHGGDKLAIYHEGHKRSFRGRAKRTILALLDGGYSVLAFDMSMLGLNTWPAWIDIPGLGPVSFSRSTHWSLAILESEDFSPFLLFFDPILRALNHILTQKDYDDVIMVGFSGGGWVTTLYAALDPRVNKSYPVAGTLPLAMRGPDRNGRLSEGDYEQRHNLLYRLASYPDLYVLGAVGEQRRQVQILNEIDTCCFPGERATHYARLISQTVDDLGMGGDWNLAVNWGTQRHEMTDQMLEFILHDAEQPIEICASKPDKGIF
ncbi:MAG: hypothetical protein AAFY56_09520 [Pseudomonadota bacterium]